MTCDLNMKLKDVFLLFSCLGMDILIKEKPKRDLRGRFLRSRIRK